MLIKFDKPLLPPLPTRGGLTKELPVEPWLKLLKVPDTQFIHFLDVTKFSKNNLPVTAHLLLCLEKMFIIYTKGISKTKEYYYRRVTYHYITH